MYRREEYSIVYSFNDSIKALLHKVRQSYYTRLIGGVYSRSAQNAQYSLVTRRMLSIVGERERTYWFSREKSM